MTTQWWELVRHMLYFMFGAIFGLLTAWFVVFVTYLMTGHLPWRK